MTARKLRPAATTKPIELGQLVSIIIAAQRLSVSDKTLRRMIDRRQIRAVKVGHGRGVWRISESELQRVIDEGSVPV